MRLELAGKGPIAVAALLAAALVGAWWPARRALRIDPAQVLRWQ